MGNAYSMVNKVIYWHKKYTEKQQQHNAYIYVSSLCFTITNVSVCDLCKATKRPWKNDEKLAVHSDLGRYFLLDRLPPKVEITACQEKHPVLSNRSWLNIKDFIRNSQLSSTIIHLIMQ